MIEPGTHNPGPSLNMKAMPRNILFTGQTSCYSAAGQKIPCSETRQDAAVRSGLPWPEPRFKIPDNHLIQDLLTGLFWTRKSNFFDFPLTWSEALDETRKLNQDAFCGFTDWRLPNRRELRSLICHGSRKPALPAEHPFEDVFLGWYWTSTTAAIFPGYAWYIHMEGGRMFYGKKDSPCLAWPVRGHPTNIPRTGQMACFDHQGLEVSCSGTGQDAEFIMGEPWPEPRFTVHGPQVHDHLTDLVWFNPAMLQIPATDWEQALNQAIQAGSPDQNWRLPSINELESLVDCSASSPALPRDHPFSGLEDVYWSSTTSCFEPDWAYALYLNKGAVGVGYKPEAGFHVWPVRNKQG